MRSPLGAEEETRVPRTTTSELIPEKSTKGGKSLL